MSRDASDSMSFPDAYTGTGDESAEALSAEVEGLIRHADPLGVRERRSRTRYPIPYSFQLIPLDVDGRPLLERTTTVVGKHLSQNGISFSHNQPLPYRRAIVSLIHPNVGRFAVEVDLLWTRRTVIGLYESGGRLTRTVRGHTLWPARAERGRSPSRPN